MIPLGYHYAYLDETESTGYAQTGEGILDYATMIVYAKACQEQLGGETAQTGGFGIAGIAVQNKGLIIGAIAATVLVIVLLAVCWKNRKR